MNLTRRTFIGSSFGAGIALIAGRRPVEAQQSALPVTANFPHILFGRMGPGGSDSWFTEFLFTNVGPSPAQVILRWYADDGNPLAVPVIGADRNSSHQFQIPVGRTVNIQLDPSSDVITQGWAAVDITGAVEGQGLFHWRSPGRPEYSAGVPMARQGSQGGLIILAGGIPVTPVSTPRSMSLRFNNIGHVTGIAVANTTGVPTTADLEFVDSNGAVLMQQVVPIGPLGHVSFATSDPRLSDVNGLVRFVGNSSAFSAISLNFNLSGGVGPYSTFLPLLR